MTFEGPKLFYGSTTEMQHLSQRGGSVPKVRTEKYSRGNPIDLLETLHHVPVQKKTK